MNIHDITWPFSTLLTLSKVLWEAKIPLVVVRSYGMIGYLRVQVSISSLQIAVLIYKLGGYYFPPFY